MIKEYCKDAETCVIRSNSYGSSLDKFLQFFEEAKKDFPWLAPEDVKIVHYAGSHYAKTFGIEFSEAKENVPDSYSPINQLEYYY